MAPKPKITFEYEETIILKQGGKLATGYCPRCDEMVDMLSPDVLSLITGESEREIFRLVETGMLHFEETDRVVVCPVCYKRSISDAEIAGFPKKKQLNMEAPK
jgi:hypothetical protein